MECPFCECEMKPGEMVYRCSDCDFKGCGDCVTIHGGLRHTGASSDTETSMEMYRAMSGGNA
jgi:hypothetical protein